MKESYRNVMLQLPTLAHCWSRALLVECSHCLLGEHGLYHRQSCAFPAPDAGQSGLSCTSLSNDLSPGTEPLASVERVHQSWPEQ